MHDVNWDFHETWVCWLAKDIVDIPFVAAYHPAVLGSDLKHTIKFCNIFDIVLR